MRGSYVMSNYNKGIKIYRSYATRKDREPKKKNLQMGWRARRNYKKVSNDKVRTYKNDLQNSDYRKVFDLWWTLF